MAIWSTAYINDLPDSSFLHIEAGGSKDSSGKTTPRSLRHFPVKDASGNVDLPHLRNALSRIPQSSLPADVKQRATAKAQAMLQTTRKAEDLETVDFAGVEILSTGGPVKAIGSPPGGDYFDRGFLQRIAEAHRELGDTIRPPGKIGHSNRQALARAGVTDGEMPAVGWLDNIRLSQDGEKLLADVRGVPSKLAKLIKAGAYRTRSVELSRFTSQRTGKRYEWVVSGLAWLGGKLPAVQNLADVVALYEGDEGERRMLVEIESRDEPAEALLTNLMLALAGESERPADTRPRMPEVTFNPDQVERLAEALNVTDDVTPDRLLEAADTRKSDIARIELERDEANKAAEAAKNVRDELDETKRKLQAATQRIESSVYDDDQLRKLEERAAAGERAEKRLYETDRDAFLKDAIKAGKFRPGQLAELQAMHDADAKATRLFVTNAPPNTELIDELGSSEDRYIVDDETRKAQEAELAQMVGIPPGEML